MEEKLWNVSSSPHVRDHSSTQSIMRDVVIALLPATIIGIYNFRLSAVLVILTCCVSCMLAEYIWQRLMKQKVTTNDFSALLTGLLLALNLPATMGNPKYLWMCILGSVFAIIVVKQLFGGLGQNFMNPALGGRCFLMLSFSSVMTSFTVKEGSNWLYGISVDAASSATPLMDVKEGGYPSLLKMFLGTTTGTIGETSTAALLLGAIYLLLRRVIDWKIPVIYIATFAVFDILYMVIAGAAAYPLLYELCGGGLMLGAFFMATDYVTSPITSKGKVIYAILLGLLDNSLEELHEILKFEKKAIINNSVIINKLIFDLCTNSNPEDGLIFSDESLQLLDNIKAFNYKNIYYSDKVLASEKYFELVLTQIFEILKSAYDKENTLENLNKMKKNYNSVVTPFIKWINCYWNLTDRENTNLQNKVLFDVNNKKDYLKAIIYYISGMTDNYAIECYNNIIGF